MVLSMLRGKAGKTREKFRVQQSVYDAIRETVGSRPAESGGVLGGSREEGLVRHYHFDHSAARTTAVYSPDHELVNNLLKREWNPDGIFLLGFVHSHPRGLRRPSGGDLIYAERILKHIPELTCLYLPIVMTEPDTGRFELLPYRAVRDGDRVRVEEMELEVLGGEAAAVPTAEPADRDAGAYALAGAPVVRFEAADGSRSLWETFRRVQGAYDLGRLAAARVMAVGAGGAASFLEELARAGVAEFVVLDPDVVSETNLATQQVYRRDLGRPKVECLAERIRDINPQAVIVAHQQKLDDINDAEFRRLATEPLRSWETSARMAWGIPGLSLPVRVEVRPAVTLLCGLTDSFEAQARVNRLALHFGLPSLCAQVYQQGRGAEVTFTHPATTPACHRCALSGRYKAYLENGFKNDVTSDGTPIFATTRLNALKGSIALALLHHGSSHPRWGKLLERIGNRNLVQIRMDPDLDLPVFERVYSGGDRERILFDDVVWLPQQPDCLANGFPTCPDCGGSGDLRKAIGTFSDTRIIRK